MNPTCPSCYQQTDAYHRVRAAAFRLGFEGDPHQYDLPAPKRVCDLVDANRILSEARVNNLPEHVLIVAKKLAQAIVMASQSEPAHLDAADPAAGKAAAKAEDLIRRRSRR